MNVLPTVFHSIHSLLPLLAGLFLVLVASCFFLGVNFLGGGSTVTAAVSSSSITTWSSRHRFLFVKKLHHNCLNYTSCNVLSMAYLLVLVEGGDGGGGSTSSGGTSRTSLSAAAAASWASFAALAAASLATATLVLGVFAPLGVWSVLFFFLPGLGADFLVLFL